MFELHECHRQRASIVIDGEIRGFLILRDHKVSLYAINLDKDKDRYSKLMKYYTNSDLADHHKLNRFSAIYGKDVDPEMWLTTTTTTTRVRVQKNIKIIGNSKNQKDKK